MTYKYNNTMSSRGYLSRAHRYRRPLFSSPALRALQGDAGLHPPPFLPLPPRETNFTASHWITIYLTHVHSTKGLDCFYPLALWFLEGLGRTGDGFRHCILIHVAPCFCRIEIAEQNKKNTNKTLRFDGCTQN